MSVPEGPSPLRVAVVSGLRWKALGQSTTQLSRILVTLLLARLLAPRDFGLAGMVLVFAGMIQLFADFGFSASIIQQKVVTEADKSTAFWTNLGVGVCLTVIGVAAAPFVARFYGEPQLTALFMVLSLTFTLAALSSTHASLLTRDMRFRTLELAAMTATFTGAATAAVAALLGAGVWSLILQSVATAATTAVFLWVAARWIPRPVLSTQSLRKLWGFGANVFGARIFGYLSRDSDNFIVGRFLGSQALGIYAVSYAVISMPFDRILIPVQVLLQPVFARLQDDLAATREAWLKGMRLCVALIAPLTLGALVVAPDFVPVVLGSKWLPAVHVVQLLAFAAFIQSISVLCPIVFQGQYRTRLMFRLSIVSFAAHLTGFVVGLRWGVLGVAAGYAISNLVVAVPTQLVFTSRLVHSSAGDVVGALRGAFEATLGMVGLVYAVRLALTAAGTAPWLRLVTCVAIGIVSFALLAAWRDPRLMTELSLHRLRDLLRRRPSVGAVTTLTSDSIAP